MKFFLCFFSIAPLLYSCGYLKEDDPLREEVGDEGLIFHQSGYSDYSIKYEEAGELIAENELEKATNIYFQLIELETNDELPYVGLGTIEHIRTNYLKSIEYYRLAISENDSSYGGYLGLGGCYFSLGNGVDAVKNYNKARFINCEIADAYWGLAISHDLISQLDSAKINAKKYIELVPNSTYVPMMQTILDK